MNPKELDYQLNNLSIPEWFTNKNIFFTGGTGFVGKALIEKILRSCPNVGKIYVLIRSKKGLNPEERIKEFTTLPLFDKLKQQQPNALSKIIPITGDVAEINLGLLEEDRKLLNKNVNIIYHCAASVRFQNPLKYALLLNTRGTREVCLLALQMEQLQFFGHISTAYCNANRQYVEEKLYEPITDWKNAITAAETIDSHLLDVLTEKFIHPLPNTYTFTKQLAEHVVKDLLGGKIACCIFRPSIIIPAVKEPEPGWIDNFNGPIGLFMGYGMGILRVVYSDPNIVSDYIPVDIIVKTIIIGTWHHCIDRKPVKENKEIKIFNICNGKTIFLTNMELCTVGLGLLPETPLKRTIWYPHVKVTASRLSFYYSVFVQHVIPALIADFILLIMGRKPRLFNIQKKIFNINGTFEYFINRDWTFINKNMVILEKKLKFSDKEQFGYDCKSKLMKHKVYYRNLIIGAKKYLLKDDNMDNVEHDRKMFHRKWILATVFNVVWYTLIFWFLFCKLDILNIFWQQVAS